MKTSAYFLATTLAPALASPAPSPASTSTLSPSSLPTATGTTNTASALSPDSSANAAQSSAIKALLAQSPEGASAPNGTLIEILVTSNQNMYIRYQHAHPHYRDFNTTNGKKPSVTGPGDDDDLGYSVMMEAIYGGQQGSLGDSMAKAWSLYRSYYGSLPTGVPSAVMSVGSSVASATAVPTAPSSS